MHIIHVFIHVRPEYIDAFKDACVENARNSIREPGIVRFDVAQQTDDLTRFVLVEVYKARDDQAKHRQTAHYAAWRDTVEKMMAEPRHVVTLSNVFPPDAART